MNIRIMFVQVVAMLLATQLEAADAPTSRKSSNPPEIRSSWDDLLEGVSTQTDWDRAALSCDNGTWNYCVISPSRRNRHSN